MKKAISLWGILERELEREGVQREEAGKAYDYRHNPSSASFKYANGTVIGACLRSLYYKANKIVKSNPSDFTGRLQMGFGDGLHSWVLGKLANSKEITLRSEASGRMKIDPLTKEVSYRVDGLVNYDKQNGCLELKFKQGYAVEKRIRDKTPDEDSTLQTICYLNTEPVEWVNLCYAARDSALRAEFQITKQGDVYLQEPVIPNGDRVLLPELCFNGIKARWLELEECLKTFTVPKRDYKVVYNDFGHIVELRQKNCVKYKSHWRCMYCDWKDYCWKQEGAKEDSIQIAR